MEDRYKQKINKIIDETIDDLKPVIIKIGDKAIDSTKELLQEIISDLFIKKKGKIYGAKKE